MGKKLDIESIAKEFIKEYYYADDGKKERFGNRIKVLREHMGYSKSELARRAGIDRSMLEKYESGKRIPKGSTLIKILNALYCDVVEFCENKQRRKFEALVEKTYVASEENNIFRLKQELDDKLSHAMSYKIGGKDVLVPRDIMISLRENINASFRILELLEGDDDQ